VPRSDRDGRRSILVVEDDPDLRAALVALSENVGHGVVEAADGLEALERLRGGTEFCLIVLASFMPRMNGWAFRAEQVKDPRLATIPVLAISADPRAATRALAPGVVATMTKPVEFERVLQVVEQHC
jgi:CheY-like chemotaxis protein